MRRLHSIVAAAAAVSALVAVTLVAAPAHAAVQTAAALFSQLAVAPDATTGLVRDERYRSAVQADGNALLGSAVGAGLSGGTGGHRLKMAPGRLSLMTASRGTVWSAARGGADRLVIEDDGRLVLVDVAAGAGGAQVPQKVVYAPKSSGAGAA